ncbi:MAG: nucleotidyltransferase domain-containing protein [Bacteroidales bacterium]|jgi:predicted nucleotidyltransferase|nr:nucleotidyltransferase domain-containing protein [Bacteroidales bacterium]
MLDTLITSKTRIKLLLKFFLNSNASSYLRNLEGEFNESTNGIRLELNKFEEAGLLQSRISGNKKIYQANTSHPLFNDIHNILLKYIGFDQIIDKVIKKLGNVNKVYLVGSFARGVDSAVIDLLLVGKNINREYLARLTGKGEKLIKRKIRYLTYNNSEFSQIAENYKKDEILLLWTENGGGDDGNAG